MGSSLTELGMQAVGGVGQELGDEFWKLGGLSGGCGVAG